MVERDPTPGEIEVVLKGMNEKLDAISSNMMTKELFNAYREASNDRIQRLEDDQKEWAKVSTAAHVQLEADSKSRHQESEAAAAADKAELKGDIKAMRIEFADYKKDVESVKRGRLNAYFGAALAIATSLILKYFVPDV